MSADVDLEHRDMMMKALQSYGHYQGHGGDRRRTTRSGTPLWDDKISQRSLAANGQPTASREFHHAGSYSRISYESENSEKSVPAFRLAQCQLRYYDDCEEDKRRRKRHGLRKKKSPPKDHTTSQRPKSAKSTPDTVLYPRAEMNGVLVDSIGHIYRASQPARPRSALPCKFTDFVRLSGRQFGWDRLSIAIFKHSPQTRCILLQSVF